MFRFAPVFLCGRFSLPMTVTCILLLFSCAASVLWQLYLSRKR